MPPARVAFSLSGMIVAVNPAYQWRVFCWAPPCSTTMKQGILMVFSVALEIPMDNGIVYQSGGLHIAGTRITVYDVVHYLDAGRQPEEIAAILRLSLEQVLTAVKYIEEHKAEVMAVHRRIEERIARGNPPEIEAMRLATRARMQASLRARQQEKQQEAKSAGNGGGC